MGWAARPSVAGAVASVAVAVGLFSRFGINGMLSRDESIYAYGGQQLSHGVAPYASIFDPKTPLATLIAGAAAGFGRATGLNQIHLIRVAFFLFSCLAVLGVYLLARRLFQSTAAGFVAAVVFASFDGFAADALSGPDAKTPGIALLALSLWLMAARRWFWAAVAGSLAFLVWQPLVIYVVVALALAAGASYASRSWRPAALGVAGAGLPLVATVTYFAAAGTLGKFWESAFTFPLTGVKRPRQTLGDRLHKIAHVIHHAYRFSGVLFWVGVVLLVALVAGHLVRGRRRLRSALRDPIVCVVFATFVFEAAYVCTDFQGYPDVFPLLVYPALGLGAGAALALQAFAARPSEARRYATVGAVVPALALAGLSWNWFANSPMHDNHLRGQEASGCGVGRLLGATGVLYALGDPTVLVTSGRRNPDRFVYMGSGVDQWKVRHTPGGFDGWTAQIARHDPKVVVLGGWKTALKARMLTWLRLDGFESRWVGAQQVYVQPDLVAAAQGRDVQLSVHRVPVADDLAGKELPARVCA